MSMSCADCAHYDSHTNSGKVATDDGLCRYNPPVSQPGPEVHGLWPVVTKSDWCAHFASEAGVAHAQAAQ